jgi:hypothetical protein
MSNDLSDEEFWYWYEPRPHITREEVWQECRRRAEERRAEDEAIWAKAADRAYEEGFDRGYANGVRRTREL